MVEIRLPYKNIEDKREWLRRYRKEHPEKDKEWNKTNNKKWSPRRIQFKDKRITIKENPRTGVCSDCGATDRKTDLHHIQYHEDDPLRDTVELCVVCHRKESRRLRSQLQAMSTPNT